MKIYTAADINSDRNLFYTKLKLRLKKVTVNNKQRKFHLEGLRSSQATKMPKQEISSDLANILPNWLITA